MSTKKSFYILCLIDFLFLGVYGLYIILPEKYYLGYYPIGIAQIILLIIGLVSLFFYIKTNILVSKEVTLTEIFLIIFYVISIVVIAISIFVWFAFSPLASLLIK